MIDFNPGVSQRHLLFFLLFTGEEPAMSKTTPALSVKQRRDLVEAGFIKLEKRGRAFHVVLTEKTWAWAFCAFDQGVPSRLKLNAVALDGLLKRLKAHMVCTGVGLEELLGFLDVSIAPKERIKPCSVESNSTLPDSALPGSVLPGRVESSLVDPCEKNLEKMVSRAYLELSGNRWNVRVPIAALRKALAQIEKDDLTAILRRMQLDSDHSLLLYPYDDPRQITPEDAAAAVHTGGRENHIVYMGG